MMVWLYETVVKPVMSDGIIILWRALGKTILVKQLRRIQRALIGICSALRHGITMTTLTMALNVILQIAGGCIPAKITIRLRETGYIKGPRNEHSEILRCFDFLPYNLNDCT